MSAEIMTAPKVAKYLGIGKNRVYEMARKHQIPHFHVPPLRGEGQPKSGRRGLRFRKGALDAWMDSHSHLLMDGRSRKAG